MKDIVKWALSILLRERDERLYGSVTFFYESGRITRVKTEKSELPKDSA